MAKDMKRGRAAVTTVALLATLLGVAAIQSAEPAKVNKPIQTFEVPTNPVSLAASPDGKFVAIASRWPSNDKPLGVWDVATGRKVVDLNDRKSAIDRVHGVTFSPDGKLLAAFTIGGNPDVRFWDTTTWQIVKSFVGNDTRGVWSLAFSPDGRFLATSHTQKRAYTVNLWNMKTGKRIASLDMGDGLPSSLEFSHDGMYLMARGGKALNIWNTTTFKQQDVKLTSGGYSHAHFSTCDNSLLAIDYDNNLCVLKEHQWHEIKRNKLRGQVGQFKCLPNSPVLAIVTYERLKSSLRLFNPASGRQVKTIVEYQRRPNPPLPNWHLSQLECSSNGNTLLSVTYGKLSVWSVRPPVTDVPD